MKISLVPSAGKLIGLTIAGSISLLAVSHGTIILQQSSWSADGRLESTFLDNDSNLLPLESRTAGWFGSSRNSGDATILNPDAEGFGKLQLGISTAGSSAWGTTFWHEPISLDVGEELTVSMTFQVGELSTGTGSNRRVRVSIFNASQSTGGIYYRDGYSDNGSETATGATGVGGFVSFREGTFSTNNALELAYRNNTSASGLLGSSGDWSTVGSVGGVDGEGLSLNGKSSFTSNGIYTMSYSIERLADVNGDPTLRYTYSYFDSNMDVVATITEVETRAGAATAFDSLAIRPQSVGDFTDQIVLQEFTVSLIPEPSTYAIFFGIGALGLVFWHRRARVLL